MRVYCPPATPAPCYQATLDHTRPPACRCRHYRCCCHRRRHSSCGTGSSPIGSPPGSYRVCPGCPSRWCPRAGPWLAGLACRLGSWTWSRTCFPTFAFKTRKIEHVLMNFTSFPSFQLTRQMYTENIPKPISNKLPNNCIEN